MILQPLLPIPALLAIFLPLLGFTTFLTVRALRRPAGTGRREAWAWLRRSGIVLAVAIIGVAPSVPRTGTDTSITAVDVFFLVDRTGSMAAEDYNGTEQRLEGVRADMESIAGDIPGARYSIISFDSQASRQLPLTTDSRSVTAWAQTLEREVTIYSQGSLVDRPLTELSRALTGASEEHPANVRLVFFMTDGENTAEGDRRSFADLAPLIDGGAVMGYGTPEGGRMKEYDPIFNNGGDAEGDYIKDTTKDGSPDALSMLDPAQLQAMADEMGIPYVHRTAPAETAQLVADVDPRQIAADGRRVLTTYQMLLWPFALLLALLLGAEAWDAGRRLGHTVGVNRA